MLAVLPLRMVTGLHYKLVKPYILLQSRFRVFSKVGTRLFQCFCMDVVDGRRCVLAISFLLAVMDAKSAYGFLNGNAVDIQDPTTPLALEQVISDIQKGSWISEAALWRLVYAGRCRGAVRVGACEHRCGSLCGSSWHAGTA